MDNEICTCRQCGYQWKRDLDGSHSCADVMPQISKLAIQDYANVSELGILLSNGEKFFVNGDL